MADINSIALSGNLTADGQVKMFANGGVINFTIASNRSVKKDNQWIDVPSFISCKYFTKGAEKLGQYLKKGTKMVVEGKLEQETWEKDGQKQSRLVINCDNIEWFNRQQAANNNVGQQSFSNDFGYPEDFPESGSAF